jgi:hypothetical protein
LTSQTVNFDFLPGLEVEQIWVWGYMRLVFEVGRRPEPDLYVDVPAGAILKTAESEVVLDPLEGSREEAGKILTLLFQRVVSARSEGGIFQLAFANEYELIAPPSEAFESWSIRGPDRFFQCRPAGEVTSW